MLEAVAIPARSAFCLLLPLSVSLEARLETHHSSALHSPPPPVLVAGWTERSLAGHGAASLQGLHGADAAPPVEDYATDDYPDAYDDNTNT